MLKKKLSQRTLKGYHLMAEIELLDDTVQSFQNTSHYNMDLGITLSCCGFAPNFVTKEL